MALFAGDVPGKVELDLAGLLREVAQRGPRRPPHHVVGDRPTEKKTLKKEDMVFSQTSLDFFK